MATASPPKKSTPYLILLTRPIPKPHKSRTKKKIAGCLRKSSLDPAWWRLVPEWLSEWSGTLSEAVSRDSYWDALERKAPGSLGLTICSWAASYKAGLNLIYLIVLSIPPHLRHHDLQSPCCRYPLQPTDPQPPILHNFPKMRADNHNKKHSITSPTWLATHIPRTGHVAALEIPRIHDAVDSWCWCRRRASSPCRNRCHSTAGGRCRGLYESRS